MQSVGGSVRGPAHQSAALPNQDAFAVRRNRLGVIAAVSDGLGSRPLSHLGASRACRAVLRAVQQWARDGSTSAQTLPDLIEAEWMALLSGLDPSDCAATCLFAYWPRSGPVTTGSLGDGLIAVQDRNGSVLELSTRDPASFSNFTTGLGVHGSSWEVRTTTPSTSPRRILLATDGVADDLDPLALGGFMEWLQADSLSTSAWRRQRRLRSHLQDWPTPRHSDDKSLVLLWARGC